MHLHSNLRTRVKYDLRGSTYLCAPGRNEVTAAELTKLRANGAFKTHAAGGHVVVHDEHHDAPAPVVHAPDYASTSASPADDQPPATAPEPDDQPPPVEPPAVDPRAKLPGESKNAHKARLAALDAAAATPPAPFNFEEWYGLDDATREAVWPTLTEDVQRAIQERDAITASLAAGTMTPPESTP